jgi:serine-type D-Ala-D-Ala carboxypeptidase/endopeptidase (penicillin-binding protein 4)
MRQRLRVLAALLTVLSPGLLGATMTLTPAAARPARPAAGGLAAEIQAALRGSTARHIDYRIRVAGVTTVSHDADRASAPASNEKLFTAITALDLLGAGFRYATTVSATSAVATNGTLHGDLVLRGSGDPTLTISDLHALARRLHARGLRHVTGRLIVDDSRYSHVTRAPGWKHKFVPEETGTVDAFTIDGNEWRGGVAFDRDPTIDNAALWRKELRKAHISIAGRTAITTERSATRTLATHRSPDLAAIVDEMLTDSVNFYAEMLLREVGAQQTGHGNAASGIAAERALAGRLHLPLGVVHDGSGLSYADRETPATLVRWLQALKTLPIYDTVYFALPLSCDTGTLVGRMCGPNLRARVRAKTGTLDHVSALSGYVTTKAGHAVTFSFLASGFKDRNFTKVLNHIDSAVGVVVRHG